MTVEQLKTYHSASHEAFGPRHPEIERTGIEVTTGPLGQGIANAVGIAIATKNPAAAYNRIGRPSSYNGFYLQQQEPGNQLVSFVTVWYNIFQPSWLAQHIYLPV